MLINFRTNYFRFFWITLAIIIFIGCTQSQLIKPKFIPTSAQVIETVWLEKDVKKAIYDKISQTIYVQTENQILIYRDGKKINSIGQLGFTQNQFNRLSDIALTPAGDLLALDNFRKQIYRFDRDGSLISNLQIDYLSHPTLLEMSNDEKIYIYDSATNEIYLYDPMQPNNEFSFGEFTFNKPQQIGRFKNTIYVYDSNLDVTYLFNSFGQEIDELAGQVVIDQFQKFQVGKYYLTHLNTGKKFQITAEEIKHCFAQSGYFTLIKSGKIEIMKIQYEKEN